MTQRAWNSAEVRKALKHFMDTHEPKLNINKWSKLAGISANTLRNFMRGISQTMTGDTLTALAASVNSTVAAITGIENGAEVISTTAAARASGLLQGDLLREVIIAIDERLAELGREDLPHRTKSGLIVALYVMALDDDRPFNITEPKYDNVVQLAVHSG